MKSAKEMHDISSENAAIQHETEDVYTTIERIANAGGFNVTCMPSAAEQMKLCELGYKLILSHEYSHKFKTDYYYIIKW